MPNDFDTTIWPEDFEDRKSFIEYCIAVAKFMYKVFTWKDIDDDE